LSPIRRESGAGSRGRPGSTAVPMVSSEAMSASDYVVLGGGVAGLTIAREIARAGRSVTVVERGAEVGGLARTVRRDGFAWDIGGHRFHSNNPDVVRWLEALLGRDLLRVGRRSRIHLRGRFIDYPIRLTQATWAFGPMNALRGAVSYAAAAAVNHRERAVTFEDWVTRRFGRVLYEIYFKPYTEKVWGIRCDELSAEWAAQRIGVPNLLRTVRHAVRPPRVAPATAVREFHYPRSGYGAITARLADEIDGAGQRILTSTALAQLRFHGRGASVEVTAEGGARRTIDCGRVISTVPVDALMGALADDPDVARAAAGARLTYRGLVLVLVAVDARMVSPDTWTYFPEPDVLFGRSHEPKHFSPAMVPRDSVTSLALEVFSSPGEPPWESEDRDLVARATDDLETIGWVRRAAVLHAHVLRVPCAYPVHDIGFTGRLARVTDALGRYPRLSLLGRTGAFAYRNADGVIEDCFRLAAQLGLRKADGVQPLLADEGRWV